MMKIKQFIRCMSIILLIGVAISAIMLFLFCRKEEDISLFQQKIALLRQSVLTDDVELEIGVNPAGSTGCAVFISVCDGSERASVYTGTGNNLTEAWDAAVMRTEKALKRNGLDPRWVKADVVFLSEVVPTQEISYALQASRKEFFRYGIAFDSDFRTALLEAELNGAQIYDYDNDAIDLSMLNAYLKKSGRKALSTLPEEYILFQCLGWLCDEENEIHALSVSGLDYGRRQVEILDGNYAKKLILDASAFLENQVRVDGSFVYGVYPQFDDEIEGYNIVRHASTIWSLICRYRLAPDDELEKKVNKTIEYMLDSLLFDAHEVAYLYEKKDNEIKLGGCGIAVVALTEYMDVFQTEKYKDVCIALGKGILSMLDQESGTYYHVLNGNFTRKEEFRTVYYDGEATFALCRLYSLTGDPVWLDAAQSAVDHFIEADYTQYKDHWVAYSMNEITKYITDRPEYYTFALENAQKNLQEISRRDTTYHTYLELLMSTFEIYDRMIENGGSAEGFDLWTFLKTIYTRASRQLNGFFYPEYAMYMENPQRILNSFMVRHDGYRVRIDDVQHNIGGYYLYCVNYEKLVRYGMLVCAGLYE